MRLSRAAVILCCLLAGALVFAACGSDSGGDDDSVSVEPLPAPPKSDFPSAQGLTLGELLETETDGPADVVVSPASMVFYAGQNRYSFGVFEKDRTQIPDAEVALYFAKVPDADAVNLGVEKGASNAGAEGEASATPAEADEIAGTGGEADSEPAPKNLAEALDQPAVGPFTASVDSLVTDAAFRAQTTSNDPDAALSVYTTQINFPSNGEWRIAALIKDGEEITTTLLPSALVGQFTEVPAVGDQAKPIDTPTADDVGGKLEEITTRVPPDSQNAESFADVVGKKPAVLLFATPQFCMSRVCGPVVDVAEQVKEEYGDRVAFVHMEIFNDNDPGKGVRPQVKAFNLPSEPWLFVTDSGGKITTALEGAFGLQELTQAVDEVAG